jgi:hypothetical protein
MPCDCCSQTIRTWVHGVHAAAPYADANDPGLQGMGVTVPPGQYDPCGWRVSMEHSGAVALTTQCLNH